MAARAHKRWSHNWVAVAGKILCNRSRPIGLMQAKRRHVYIYLASSQQISCDRRNNLGWIQSSNKLACRDHIRTLTTKQLNVCGAGKAKIRY